VWPGREFGGALRMERYCGRVGPRFVSEHDLVYLVRLAVVARADCALANGTKHTVLLIALL